MLYTFEGVTDSRRPVRRVEVNMMARRHAPALLNEQDSWAAFAVRGRLFAAPPTGPQNGRLFFPARCGRTDYPAADTHILMKADLEKKRYGFDHPVRTRAGALMDAFAVSISTACVFPACGGTRPPSRRCPSRRVSGPDARGRVFCGPRAFADVVSAFDHWIAFALLGFIGGKMMGTPPGELRAPEACPVAARSAISRWWCRPSPPASMRWLSASALPRWM